jgi:hypothetical protein
LLKGLTINKFSSKGNGDRKFQKLQSTWTITLQLKCSVW